MIFEKSLGYNFKDKNLLRVALTHKSFFHENNQKLSERQNQNKAGMDSQQTENKNRTHLENVNETHRHNEKLEFLGDAVVDLSVSELLMQKFPGDTEGNLSKKRASLVNETVLAEVAERLGVSSFLLLGKGEILSGGNKKPRLLASALEALLGAIFIEAGYDQAHQCLQVLLKEKLETMTQEIDFGSDFKTRLQEIVQGESKAAPTYRLVSEKGPPHDRIFEIEVNIQEYPPVKGEGRSKKAAEQEAARLALKIWKEET